MGRLKGILPIQGSVGTITFTKTGNGIIVRERTDNAGNGAAQNKPAQAAHRAEFGAAGKGAHLFRKGFDELVHQSADSHFTGRLVKQMMAVVRGDSLHPLGQRLVAAGNLQLLQGFNCNVDAPVDKVLHMAYTASITRSSGAMEVAFPAFNPAYAVSVPSGATHMVLSVSGAAFDFTGDALAAQAAAVSAPISLSTPAAAFSLGCNIGAGSTLPLFLVLGVWFAQEVNGGLTGLDNVAFNALAIVKVDA